MAEEQRHRGSHRQNRTTDGQTEPREGCGRCRGAKGKNRLHPDVSVLAFQKYLLLPLLFLNSFVFLRQVAAIQAEVTKQQQETEEDLAKAEPALQAANAALNTLNRVSHPAGT